MEYCKKRLQYPRLSKSPFQFFYAIRKYAGKYFSPLQRAKSTGRFFDRGVEDQGGLFELIIQISLQ